MTVMDMLLLTAALVALAALPSASVVLVVTRSASKGLGNGLAVAAGIVVGDLVFVLLAVFGMTVLAEVLGGFFLAVRILAACYLIWFGVNLLRAAWRAETRPAQTPVNVGTGGHVASLLSGLLLTLGDAKAIFFYASLFPTFVNLATISANEIVAICLITIFAVGGVKVIYACCARLLAAQTVNHRFGQILKAGTGFTLIGAGTTLLVRP